MPQLQLKVPVFRRWGKRFFVVVDTQFFSSLPPFKPEDKPSNREVIWLNYPIVMNGNSYTMMEPEVIGSKWEDVVTALREGEEPEPQEILAELQAKMTKSRKKKPLVFSV
jgi:hypothetical protein